MKREHTTAAGSLRAVALAITVVSVVTFVAVGYSAYSDVSGVQNVSQSGSHAVTARTVTQGNSATVYINATIANGGLLPLMVSLSCQGSQPGVSCTTGSVTVSPGENGTLRFQMTVANVSQFGSNLSGLHVNGTLMGELIPFASISVTFDLGSLLGSGGG